MMYTFTGPILFLLVVANAQNLPEDIQAEVTRGRSIIIQGNVLFNIQTALEQARVALSSATDVSRGEETATINNLLAGQFAEIKRVTSYLRNQDASRCTKSSLEQARDAVYDSGTIYENCVNQNLKELRRLIQNLTSLEFSYKIKFIEQGPSTIQRCATNALRTSDPVAEARDCIDRFLEEFSNANSNAEAILRSVDGQINQALRIIPTCTNRARSNATTAVNAILESIRVCAEGSGVAINITRFANYTDGLSNSVEQALSQFNTFKELISSTQRDISSLEDILRQLYDQAKQITPSYVNDVFQRMFSLEISIVKNASSARGLTFTQILCVNRASVDLRRVLVQAGVAWILCAKRVANQIYEQVLSAESLSVVFNGRIRSEGIAAYMRCVTQNNANATAANDCIRRQSANLLAYLNSIQPQLETRKQTAIDQYIALQQCRSTFETNTKTEVSRIINTLKTCVPQLGIQYN